VLHPAAAQRIAPSRAGLSNCLQCPQKQETARELFPASGAGVLMSSCAFFSAFPCLSPGIHIRLQSEDGFLQTEGFRGAWHDLISPLGRTAVISHFRQLNLICRLPLA